MSEKPPRLSLDELKERFEAMQAHYTGEEIDEPEEVLRAKVVDLIVQAYHYRQEEK